MLTLHSVVSPTFAPKSSLKESDPVDVPGMGAIPSPDGKGTVFRVWAPHAEQVSVVGTFNNWDGNAHPLEKVEETWSGHVPEAKVGDEYKFILKREGVEYERMDPRALKVTNSVGNCVIWQLPTPAARFKAPTLDQLVIYEMHIGTFNVTEPGRPGTFASAIEKLPYLRDLGVNAIELMPVAEFAGDFSWGYNPAHPFAVESAYGGPEGLLAFVQAAHALEIAVILDVVYNHFGPSDLSLWQFDAWSENDLGGIYFYNDWRSDTPWGHTRPDYSRGEVRTYIKDNAMMWLRNFGIDGLRWDMAVYIRSVRGNPGDVAEELKEGWSLCQWVNEEIHREFPGAITIAEDLRDSEWIVKAPSEGGAGFSAQWDAAFVHPVRQAVIVPHDEHRDLDSVINALKIKYNGDAFKRVVYSESHDDVANGNARLPSEIAANDPAGYYARKRSSLGAALTLTAPGIPMLFQGQEFLEDEWFRDEVPLKWDRFDQFSGIFRLYQDLISLRRSLSGNTAGLGGQHVETHHVNHENKVLAFRRWREGGAGDDVMVVVNLSANSYDEYVIGVPGEGCWKVRLNSDGSAYSADFTDQRAVDFEAIAEPRDGYPYHVIAGLAPYSVLIFSQDRPASEMPVSS